MQISINNQGSIVILTPLDNEAKDWFEESVNIDQMWCDGYVIEHRYAPDIIDGFIDAGGSVV